nr:threonine dehydratase [Sphingomonas sp. Root710]
MAELEDAAQRIHRVFPATPQQQWPLLSAKLGAELWVKHENHTPTGAFKLRGGLIHVEQLAIQGLAPNGLISATRGNHGLSLGYAGQWFGLPVKIVVPHGNSAEKNAAMRALGVDLVEHGTDFDAARLEATRLADHDGLRLVPAFHRDLVLGVATWALELFRAAKALDILYVPIGLGSSICGAIMVRDLLGLSTQIVGVESTGAPTYQQSIEAGEPISLDRAETLADGLAVRIPDRDAFDMIRAGVSRIVTVTDEEIAEAIRLFWTCTHNLAEGAGAAALAGALKEAVAIKGKRVGIPLSGGNIDLALFEKWVSGHR